jgi:exonuclease SbcD
MSPVYDGNVKPKTLTDEFGEINVYMLPFIKPSNVRRFYPDEEIVTYTDAVKVAVDNMNIDASKRNILVTHQFVTGATRSESEDISVGGSDNVDAAVFEGFDYVALGHIHRSQKCSSEYIRYCGTLLKYSFSEERHKKSVVFMELDRAGSVNTELLPLKLLHEMRTVRGPLEALLSPEVLALGDREDYIRAQVTDDREQTDVLSRLRVAYPNLMELHLESRKYRQLQEEWGEAAPVRKSAEELFADFYEMQNGRPMEPEEEVVLLSLEEVPDGKEGTL